MYLQCRDRASCCAFAAPKIWCVLSLRPTSVSWWRPAHQRPCGVLIQNALKFVWPQRWRRPCQSQTRCRLANYVTPSTRYRKGDGQLSDIMAACLQISAGNNGLWFREVAKPSGRKACKRQDFNSTTGNKTLLLYIINSLYIKFGIWYIYPLMEP